MDNVLKETTNIPDGWDYNGTGSCNSLHHVRVDATLGCNVVLTNTQPFSISCTGGGGTFAVYPNPASIQLNVEFVADEMASSSTLSTKENEPLNVTDISNQFSVVLLNSSNQTVIKGSSQAGKISLDTHTLPSGSYYIHISKNGEIITKEILLKK